MTHKPRPDAGFSIIAVLIVMGVVLFSMLLISQAKYRAQGTQKAIKTKQSYADINQALINSVVEVFHKNIEDSCDGLVSSKLKNEVSLDGASKYSFKTAIKDLPETIPEVHKKATDRCRSPKNPGSSGNRFYFCVQLNQDGSAPKDSILNSKYAFAEFAVELIDLQTTEPITCATYKARKKDTRDGSEGMAVTMALYWANQAGANDKQFNFSQKALSYIANQN